MREQNQIKVVDPHQVRETFVDGTMNCAVSSGGWVRLELRVVRPTAEQMERPAGAGEQHVVMSRLIMPLATAQSLHKLLGASLEKHYPAAARHDPARLS